MALQPQQGPSVSEYLVSAIPWVTSSVASGIVRIDFKDDRLPVGVGEKNYISKWVMVNNTSSGSLKIAFTQNGFSTFNSFTLGTGLTFSADLRLSNIFISGSAEQPFELVAGLTGILSNHVSKITGSNGYPGVG